jgi:nucleoside-diphosphate-sugar epimerase
MGGKKQMNVLVTGGCGYIGLWVCRKLKEAGHNVSIVDKMFFPTGVNAVDEFVGDVETIYEYDLRDMPVNVLDGIDAVCHLGGLSNDPTAAFNPEANKEMNYIATENLANMVKHHDTARRIIFASSASVYGFNTNSALTEESTINPQSEYASSKYDAEREVLDMYDCNPDYCPTVFRQATVMGWSPRHRHDLVVNAMTKSALVNKIITVNAGGEALRPLVDVQDVAEAYVRCLSMPYEKVAGEVFNLAHKRNAEFAHHEGYTIASLALWIKHIINERGYDVEVKGSWEGTENRSYDMTCKRLRDTFGWSPARGVASAVNSIIEQYEAGNLKLEDHEANNIGWMEALDYGQKVSERTGGIFDEYKAHTEV